MTITERFHAVYESLLELLHLHPASTADTSATHARVIALAQHPDVPPETQAVIASLAQSAATANGSPSETPPLTAADFPGGVMPTVPGPAPTVAAEPVTVAAVSPVPTTTA